VRGIWHSKIIGLVLGSLSLALISSLQASSIKELEDLWGLSPIKQQYRSPLEKIEFQDIDGGKKRLLVSNWYEDLSVTQNAVPDRRLYCRFMHSFLYGRAAIRSQRLDFPATVAFQSYPDVQSIRFVFFALVYRNEPTSPYWDKSPAPPPAGVDPNAKLRVTWKREEEAVPYLSLDISRDHWKTIERLLKGRPNYTYSAFRRELCESIYKVVPGVRANFAALEKKREN